MADRLPAWLVDEMGRILEMLDGPPTARRAAMIAIRYRMAHEWLEAVKHYTAPEEPPRMNREEA